MHDPAVNPFVEEREPRFFRGLFLAFLVCSAAYGAAALLAGCATDPATGDVTVRVPAAAVDAATNAAARAVVAIREAREASSHSQAETTGKQESGDPAPAAVTVPAAGPESPGDEAPPPPTLEFRHGGFKGGSAKEDPRCRISKLKVGSDSLSLHWDTKIPSDWARETGDKGALVVVAAFYRAGDRWIGGKFDWIDESRSSRSLENIRGGYGGWDGAAWTAAKRHAVCVVSADGRWRSNLVED